MSRTSFVSEGVRVRKFDGRMGRKWPAKRKPFDATAPGTAALWRGLGVPGTTRAARTSSSKGD